jgi:hypothetical protein
MIPQKFGIGDYVATLKGDSPGHPFRGNQYEGGAGGGESSGGNYKTSSMSRDEAFNELEGMSDEFNLWNPENEGDTIHIAEDNDGNVIAFMQSTGNVIYDVESLKKGAGTQLVDEMKKKHDYLMADNVGANAAKYWEHQGFVREKTRGLAHTNYEWYKDYTEAPEWYQDEIEKRKNAS